MSVTNIAPPETHAELGADNECPNGNKQLIVRPARDSDLNELVKLELTTFGDVYGEDPHRDVVKSIEKKYAERVSLLGSWFTVLADDEDRLSGMLVCCKTSLDEGYFLGKEGGEHEDMTSAGAVETVFDPEGKNLYIVNLAVSHSDQDNASSLDLILDGMIRAKNEGIQKAYFTSRLPRFMHWLQETGYSEGLAMKDKDLLGRLADQYVEFRRPDGKLYDPLLELYVGSYGARVLRAIPEAWVIDYPSKAFGAVGVYDV